MGSPRQLGTNIPPKWRTGDLIVGQLAIEFAKAVVMLRGKNEVFRSGVLGNADPFRGIEVGGIETSIKGIVFGYGNFRALVAPIAPLSSPAPTYLGSLE